MGLFNWLTPKAEEPKTLEVIPENPQQFIYPVLNDYRKGMWVKTPAARIGILNRFTDNGCAEVHLTDAKGMTLSTEEYPISSLVRAKRSEIPEDRINHLTRADTRALGYED
jgi:CxxC motif-containing protein (DUF1111 family)